MCAPLARTNLGGGSSTFLATALLALAACSGTSDGGGRPGDSRGGSSGSSSTGDGGAAGNPATGGEPGSGGTTSGVGGGSGTGGTSDTDGSTGTGGTTQGSGGAEGTGGSAGSGTGGSGGTGGSASGASYVFVSGYGGIISSFLFDPQAGSLTPAKQLSGVQAPSFLAWHAPDNHLYALNEIAQGHVEAYAVAADGSISLINGASSGGAGPAYLMVDPTGKWVLVANYDGGTASVLPIQKGGGVGAPVDTVTLGPDTTPHEIVLDPAQHFAFVMLKGDDSIAQFSFDSNSGKLTPNTPARVMVPQGSGPRHLAFRPNAKSAYLITEQGSTMIAFSYDAAKGTLAQIQSLTTLPKGSGGGITAEVAVHPSGQWVYGSNRSTSDIVQFALDDAGKMTLVGHTSTGGQTPRHFSIDPTGQTLLVANQDSDNVLVLRIGSDGKLTPIGDPISVQGSMPTFVGALQMP